MGSYKFNHIIHTEDLETADGVSIWVWHANKVPPHIGISVDGLYYSLKVSGKDQRIPLNQVIQLIQRKKIPTVQLKLTRSIHVETVRNVFCQFETASPGIATCLTPLTKLLACEEAKQLVELLPMIHDEIEATYGYFLPEGFEELQKYSQIDIQNRLEALSHVASS